MGQFEIKGEKSINLKPDTVEITAICMVSEFVKNDKKVIESTKLKLKDSVSNIRKKIKDIDGVISVGNDNLNYKESKNEFSSPSKVFGKKRDDEIYVEGNVKIIVKLKLSEDVIRNVMKVLLDNVDIVSIYDSVSVSDLEDKYTELKSELCKKCRKDADTIVECLGAKITGIDKIIYNSSGALIQPKNNSYAVPNSYINSVCCLDECGDECADFSGFGDLDIPDFTKINSDWVDGFVTTILERDYPISDSVTVVFNVS